MTPTSTSGSNKLVSVGTQSVRKRKIEMKYKGAVMKKFMKTMAVCLAAVFVLAQCSLPAYAYFQRGTVGVSVGKSSVTITQGSSENVSVSFSPASSTHLPGCGMPECPQSCGEKECLDANGECTCNGESPQTYYAKASVSSNNTSVATVTYKDGVLTIKGVGAGNATITVTAELNQYTSSSATVSVTVNQKSSSGGSSGGSGSGSNSGGSGGNSGGSTSGNGGSGSSSGSSSGGNSSGNNSGGSTSGSGSSAGGSSTNGSAGVTANPVNGSNAADGSDAQNPDQQTEETEDPQTAAEGEITQVESDRGTILMIPIVDGAQGSEQFAQIKDQEMYADFQKKDSAGTVLYAWEFYGKTLTSTDDMNLNIESGMTAFEGCSYGSASDSLYLAFAQEGAFNGPASIYIKTDTPFSADQSLNLYQYNEEDDTVTLLASDLKIENGYVTLELSQGGKYILSSETFENVETTDVEETAETSAVEEVSQDESRSLAPVVIVVVIAAAAAVCGFFFYKKKKGSKE